MKIKYASISLLIVVNLIVFTNSPVSSQVIAGSAPAGSFTVDPNIVFSIVNDNEDTTRSLDLNCDNIPDMTLQLIRGQTSIDGANAAFIYVNNPLYQICSDTLSFGVKNINFYSVGDTLNCSGSFNFTNDTIYKLGDYGCLGCMGPWAITDKYIAWTDGVNVGWIKVSFDLMDGGGVNPITLSSHEFLTYCNPNSVDDLNSINDLEIIPNPTTDGKVLVEYKGVVKSVDVFNVMGQKTVTKFDGTRLVLPSEKGIYIVIIKNAIGQVVSRKVIRE